MIYPGEELVDAPDFTATSKSFSAAIKPLPVVPPNYALRLEARVDHSDGVEERKAGDQWHVEGPVTYMPTPEAVSLEDISYSFN